MGRLAHQHLGPQLRYLRGGAAPAGTSGVQPDLEVGRVDLQQQIAGLHDLIVPHQQLHHLAGNARRQARHMRVDEGVIG
jgi:hypothetical protein